MRFILLSLLIVAFPLTQFLGGPIIGHIADKKGRQYGFIIALLGESFGFLFTGLGIAIKNYLLVIFSRLLSGFFAGNFTICLSTIADLHLNVRTRAKDFGTVAGIAGTSFVVAIAIGGILSDRSFAKVFNSSLPFWMMTALSLINALIIHKFFTETQQHSHTVSENYKTQFHELLHISRKSNLKILYLVFFSFMLGWGTSLQFLSSFLIEHFHSTKTMIVTLFISTGLAWCISNMWLERILIRIFSPSKILLTSLLLTTLTLFAASVAHTYHWFFFFILSGSIFASLVWTNCLALISIKAPNHLQGKLLGINQSIATLSMIFAPFLGGLISDYDTRTIYLFASSLLLISLTMIFILKNKINKKY